MTGFKADTMRISHDDVEQCRQALEIIKNALGEAQCRLEDVVQVS